MFSTVIAYSIPVISRPDNTKDELHRWLLKTDYLPELGDLRQEFNEMKQMLVNLEKGTSKSELIHDRTDDELQDQCLGPAGKA